MMLFAAVHESLPPSGSLITGTPGVHSAMADKLKGSHAIAMRRRDRHTAICGFFCGDRGLPDRHDGGIRLFFGSDLGVAERTSPYP